MTAISEGQRAAQLKGHPKDRWLFWPAALVLVGVSIVSFLCEWPGLISFILIPITVLSVPIVVITLLATTVVFSAKRRFRTAASVLVAVLLPMALLKPLNWVADCLHLALTAGFGIGQLGSGVPKGDEFYVFDWSVGLAGGPNTWLIHDVTDEIALPVSQHQHPLETENGWGEDCAGKVKHLPNHYYICTF